MKTESTNQLLKKYIQKKNAIDVMMFTLFILFPVLLLLIILTNLIIAIDEIFKTDFLSFFYREDKGAKELNLIIEELNLIIYNKLEIDIKNWLNYEENSYIKTNFIQHNFYNYIHSVSLNKIHSLDKFFIQFSQKVVDDFENTDNELLELKKMIIKAIYYEKKEINSKLNNYRREILNNKDTLKFFKAVEVSLDNPIESKSNAKKLYLSTVDFIEVNDIVIIPARNGDTKTRIKKVYDFNTSDELFKIIGDMNFVLDNLTINERFDDMKNKKMNNIKKVELVQHKFNEYREKQYIYIGLIISGSSKIYYYLLNSFKYQIGDRLLIKTKYGIKSAKVYSIKNYAENENKPYPLGLMKIIDEIVIKSETREGFDYEKSKNQINVRDHYVEDSDSDLFESNDYEDNYISKNDYVEISDFTELTNYNYDDDGEGVGVKGDDWRNDD
jgi:hypothetical protein